MAELPKGSRRRKTNWGGPHGLVLATKLVKRGSLGARGGMFTSIILAVQLVDRQNP